MECETQNKTRETKKGLPNPWLILKNVLQVWATGQHITRESASCWDIYVRCVCLNRHWLVYPRFEIGRQVYWIVYYEHTYLVYAGMYKGQCMYSLLTQHRHICQDLCCSAQGRGREKEDEERESSLWQESRNFTKDHKLQRPINVLPGHKVFIPWLAHSYQDDIIQWMDAIHTEHKRSWVTSTPSHENSSLPRDQEQGITVEDSQPQWGSTSNSKVISFC